MDVFSGLGSLFGNADKRRDGGSSGAGCLCGIDLVSLIRTVVSDRGAKALERLLGNGQTPYAAAGGNPPGTRTFTTLRAIVYASRTDAGLSVEEKLSIANEVRNIGLSLPDCQRIAQFLFEDIKPEEVARNIADPDEAVWVYAVSCSLIRVVSGMKRGYLDQLARALRIPDTEKSAIERRSVRQGRASTKDLN